MIRAFRYRLARLLARLTFKIDGSAWPTAPRPARESIWVSKVPVMTGRPTKQGSPTRP